MIDVSEWFGDSGHMKFVFVFGVAVSVRLSKIEKIPNSYTIYELIAVDGYGYEWIIY